MMAWTIHRGNSVSPMSNTPQIGKAPHERANYFIATSRQYFPTGTKLSIYAFGWSYLRTFAMTFALVSLLGAMSANPSLSKVPAVFFLLGDAACVAIFIQHEYVNQKSLPVVFGQRTEPQQLSLSTSYTVVLTELRGAELERCNVGMGYMKLARGYVQYQAFNLEALQNMSEARTFSRIMLPLYTCLLMYNFCFCVA